MKNPTILKALFASLFTLILNSASVWAFDYSVAVSDPENHLGADRAQVLANLDAALDDWGRFIESSARLAIRVEVKLQTGGAGRFSGRSYSNTLHHVDQDLRILEESASFKLRTGRSVDDKQPDLVIEIQPELLRKSYWIDPHPRLRTDPVPKGRIDLVTVFAHELGHAFGINGWIDLKTGKTSEGKFRSLFQSMIDGAESKHPVFMGDKTRKVYGGPLPLSFFVGTKSVVLEHQGKLYKASASETQNFWHYGRFDPKTDESDLSVFGLMAGVWVMPDPDAGLRIRVGKLDAAILGDLGIPLHKGVL